MIPEIYISTSFDSSKGSQMIHHVRMNDEIVYSTGSDYEARMFKAELTFRLQLVMEEHIKQKG